MDFSDPKVWKDGIEVVGNNLHIVGPLIGLSAIAAWWFRGWVEKAEKSGLKEHVSVLEQRLKLAHESEQFVGRKSDELRHQVETLSAQVATKVPALPDIAYSTATITNTAGELSRANNALAQVLTMPIPNSPVSADTVSSVFRKFRDQLDRKID
jgi:hypothetical protein